MTEGIKVVSAVDKQGNDHSSTFDTATGQVCKDSVNNVSNSSNKGRRSIESTVALFLCVSLTTI